MESAFAGRFLITFPSMLLKIPGKINGRCFEIAPIFRRIGAPRILFVDCSRKSLQCRALQRMPASQKSRIKRKPPLDSNCELQIFVLKVSKIVLLVDITNKKGHRKDQCSERLLQWPQSSDYRKYGNKKCLSVAVTANCFRLVR